MAARLLVVAQFSALAFAYNGGVFGNRGFGPTNTDDCAYPCITNFWQTTDPDPKEWCDKGVSSVGECISSACSASSNDYDDYKTNAQSLCSTYLSCSSTGTYTYTVETPGGGWWQDRNWDWGKDWFNDDSNHPGRRHGDRRRENNDENSPKTVTVTGCPWYGDGFGFPFWHGLGFGSDFWTNKDQQKGWSLATKTSTVTETISSTSGDTTASVKPTKEVVVVQAVSGDLTTESTVTVKETGGSSPENSDGGADTDTNGDENGASTLATSQCFAAIVISILLLA